MKTEAGNRQSIDASHLFFCGFFRFFFLSDLAKPVPILLSLKWKLPYWVDGDRFPTFPCIDE